MGRKPNTDTRRAEIVDALLQELASVGYERATTKSIAARAGLTPGLVHYHFEDKAEILLGLVDRLIAQADARHAQLLTNARSPQARLAAFVTARVGLGESSDATEVRAWVSVIAEALAQPPIRSRLARWFAHSQAMLETEFRAVNSATPREHAALLLAMVHGVFSMHALQVDGLPVGYAERQIHAWLAHAVRRRRTGSKAGRVARLR
jgi:TetR/AcrR family transcriptional repressor of bet genes